MGALIKSWAFSDLGEVNGLPPLPYLVSLSLLLYCQAVRSCNLINFTARSAGENP